MEPGHMTTLNDFLQKQFGTYENPSHTRESYESHVISTKIVATPE